MTGRFGTTTPQPARPREGRARRAGMVGSVLVVLLALGLGLPAWLSGSAVRTSGPAISLPQFAHALDSMANASSVHYRSTTSDGRGRIDLQVTASEDLVGTVTQGGRTYRLLRLDGHFYLKAPAGVLNPAGGKASRSPSGDYWITGRTADEAVGSIPSHFHSPAVLAQDLRSALRTSQAYDPHRQIDGVPVVAAKTPRGVLYVSNRKPYRLVSLGQAPRTTPAGGTSSARAALYRSEGPHAWPAAEPVNLPLADSSSSDDSSAVSFPPAAADDTAKAREEIKSERGQLDAVVDPDLTAAYDGSVAFQCSEDGCTAVETGTVRASSSSATVTGVDIIVDFTIEGEAAGSCEGSSPTSQDGPVQVSCSDPSAGAAFAEADAKDKAAAEAAAPPGVTSGTYQVNSTVSDKVYVTVAATPTARPGGGDGSGGGDGTDTGSADPSAGADPSASATASASASASAGGADSAASEPSVDQQAQALVKEHTDGKNNPQLTLDNAVQSLNSAPEGYRVRVMPLEHMITAVPGTADAKAQNPDLEYLDRTNRIVGYGEVKTIGTAIQKAFDDQLSKAIKQLRWRQDRLGGTQMNKIFLQVPDGMDPTVLRQWLSAWQKARRGGLGSIRGYDLQVLAADGDVLGDFDLGTALGPDPSTSS